MDFRSLGARRLMTCITLVCIFAASGSVSAHAGDDAGDAAREAEEPERSPLAVPSQIGDEPLEPFDPVVPRTSADEMRAAARAWYMTGKIHESRGAVDPDQFAVAVEAYRKAINFDPEALAIYESLIPVLYAQGDKEEAQSFALQAGRTSLAGIRIVRGLAAVMAQGDSLSDAVEILQKALEQDTLQDESVQRLLVHRDLGLYLHMSDHPEEAAESYQLVFKALVDGEGPELDADARNQLLGDAGATYDEIGKTFLEAKLPDLAVRAFDKAAEHRTERPGLHSYNLALVFHETGKHEEALAELQNYFDAQLQSKGRAAYELFKELLVELDRGDELLPRLEEFAERDARNEFLAYFLADEYIAAGQVEKGKALLEETLADSTDPRGLVGLLEVYRREKNAEKLLTLLGKLYPQMPQPESDDDRQKLPDDVLQLVERYEAALETLAADEEIMDGLTAAAREQADAEPPKIDLAQVYMVGKLSIDAERTEDVVHFYQLAISMMNVPTFDLYRELGEYLIDIKDYERAAEVFREGAENPALQQARWIFLYFLSYPLEFDGKTDEALEVIAEARGSQPENSQLHFQEAWIHYHAHQWEAAEALFKEVISTYTSPDDERIVRNSQFSLSNIYVQQGDLERGEQILEDVLKEDPDSIQANNDLGYLWADQNKNLDRAREMIEKALAAEPENPAYLDSMGWVLYRLEEYEEAAKFLQQATEQENGEDSTIYDHLGDCLQKLGREEEAAAAWSKALELEEEKTHPDEELLSKLREKAPGAKSSPPEDEKPPDASAP